MALVITYLPASSFSLSFLLGAYLMQRRDKRSAIKLSTIILCMFILLLWLSYRTVRMYTWVLSYSEGFIDDLIHGTIVANFFNASRITAQGVEEISAWANITQFFWIIFIYIFGTALGLKNLITAKNQPEKGETARSELTRECGGLMGTLGF